MNQTHLHYRVFVAAAHHGALHRLLALLAFFEHLHRRLLVVSVLALPETKEVKNLQKENVDLPPPTPLNSLIGHTLVSDQCPAPRVCVSHLVGTRRKRG